jgi:hypothetical protein
MSERSSDHSLRDPVSHVLTVLGIIALAAGAALGQVRRGLFESDAFADRLASSLGDPRVSAYVAQQIADEAIRAKPDLVAVRPVIVSTAHGVVSTDAFRSVVRTTARSAHATAFSQGGRNLLLSVPDVDVILRGALANASPALAARIPERLPTVIASLGESPATRLILDLWQSGRHLAWTARALVLGGLVLLVLGIALARHRAEALRRAALDMALAGLFLALLLPAARGLARSLPAEAIAQQAAAGLFDAFSRGLRQLALGLAGVGLVFAAAAQSLVGRALLPETVERLASWIRRPPASPWGRFLRGAFFLGGGTLMILRPSAAVTVLGLVAGAVVAFLGLQELFRLLVRPVPEEERTTTGPFRRREQKRAAVVLGLAIVLAACVAWLGRPPEIGIVRVSTGCNGDERLCDRTLDAIALPGAHNAMSSVDAPNWMFPQQERSVTGQLEDGVRALLVDVHAGVPVSGRIRTDLSEDPAMLAKMEKAVGKEGLLAANRIRSRLTGPPEGPRGLFLCHGFCELGALPFVPWLRAVREFLVANPGEVVVVVIEDYVPPGEMAAAFTESGLADLVYRGAPRPPWPTLRQLAESRQRVVVFLESGKPGVEWMHPAFQAIQETPYTFHQPTEFTCVANRGGTGGSLFQINHWIETTPMPKPTNAAIVNAYDFLLGRARSCAQERAHLPNVVAVDFYRTGDLFRVVRTLNGLDPTAPSPAPSVAQ